jgi:hypothetical protein
VVAVDAGEDLQRPGDVQALHVVEDRHQHGTGPHGSIVEPSPDGSNDADPTFSATAGGLAAIKAVSALGISDRADTTMIAAANVTLARGLRTATV